MTRLDVGRSGGSPFTLPASIASQTFAVLGVRGSGKTVTASVIVEELLEIGQQVVIVDPTDVWWGLKSSGDGEEEGYPVVIFGGDHADLPLEPTMGAALADFVVENRVPMILSLRHLRKNAQRRFVTDFCEQLYHRKGETKYRTPLTLIFDEASRSVPQRVAGDTARMVGAVEEIVRLGRASGFGVGLVDQRPASVNKDVLTQLEVLVSHRITSPQDSKALDAWISQHDTEGFRSTFLKELPALTNGTAWFWSPVLDLFEQVQVRMRHTFDSSKTPEPGEQIEQPKAWAKVDLQAVGEQLLAAVEEAEENDPKALKARVRELEGALKEAEKERDLAITGDRQDYPTVEAYELVCEARSAWQRKAEAWEAKAMAVADRLGGVIDDLQRGISPDTDLPTPAEVRGIPQRSTPAARSTPDKAAAAVDIEPPGVGDGPTVSGPGQKLLDALATYEAFGQEDVDVVALAMLAGYRPGTGHFNNIRGELRSQELIDYPSPGRVALTVLGRACATCKPIRTLEDLHAAWAGVLDGPQWRVLEVLIDAYPAAIAVDSLATRAGYSAGTGHFNNIRGSLRTLGAIEYPSRGKARASDRLFPAGLR